MDLGEISKICSCLGVSPFLDNYINLICTAEYKNHDRTLTSATSALRNIIIFT